MMTKSLPKPSILKALISVSYTHLRAHETPEHLVCRLLLEKKNILSNVVLPQPEGPTMEIDSSKLINRLNESKIFLLGLSSPSE